MILVGVISYAALSGIFLIALLRSAARTSDDWTTSTLSSNQTLAETNSVSVRACGDEVAIDASLMVAKLSTPAGQAHHPTAVRLI